MNTKGPTRFTIPSRVTTRCGICEYHQCHSSLCTRSGSSGWRDYACSHPDAFKGEEVPGHEGLVAHIEAIERQSYGGRLIGRTEETPDWCPFLREANDPR